MTQITGFERTKRLLILFVLLVWCIGCDQATKQLASRNLDSRVTLSFLGDTVRLQHVQNPGAFLGLGGRLPEAVRFRLLTGVNALLLFSVTVVLLVKWNMDRKTYIGLALILAGGIGNLIDRVSADGHVTDFINLGVGPVRTGIFNVADVAIMAGLFLLAVWAPLGKPKPTAPPSFDTK